MHIPILRRQNEQKRASSVDCISIWTQQYWQKNMRMITSIAVQDVNTVQNTLFLSVKM